MHEPHRSASVPAAGPARPPARPSGELAVLPAGAPDRAVGPVASAHRSHGCPEPTAAVRARAARTPASRRTPPAAGHLPLAHLLQPADPPLDQVTPQQTQVVNEKPAPEMVNFMAEGACQQALATHLVGLTAGVLRTDGDELRSRDQPPKTRQRQASFLLPLLPLGVDDLRVGQHQPRFGIFPDADVNDRQSQRNADLRCRQPDASAAYMDSNMSSTSRRSSSSNFSTGGVGRSRIGSGYLTMGRIMASQNASSCRS